MAAHMSYGDGDTPIERFMRGDVIAPGIMPVRIDTNSQRIDVTTHDDSTTQYIQGRVQHTVEIVCSPEGLLNLVAMLTGTTPGDMAPITARIIEETTRKVKL